MSRGSKPGCEANGYKHGMMGTLEYNSWQGMRQRCHNPNNPGYSNYGARGIEVCERWRASFKNFLEDMGKAPSPEHSIDRFPDMNGNYEPNNCRWATDLEQLNNTRRNVFVEHEGEKLTISQLARKMNMDKTTLRVRLIDGMTVEQATSLPLKQERTYSHDGQTKTLREWSDQSGLSFNVLYLRVEHNGWTLERALTQDAKKARTFSFNDKECTVREISEATGIEYKTLHARLISYGWSVQRATTEKIRDY